MSDLHLRPNQELTDSDFIRIANLVHDRCGICLHGGKKELVKARLGKRIRNGQCKSYYYQYVVQDQMGQELVSMLDAIAALE
jgi:chemotaxis protein methyltransferase CheR